MTEEADGRLEPAIWFEGTLIREPQELDGSTWLIETMPAMTDGGRKITVRARGGEHSENIRRNARRGTRLMVRGTAGDEGSGIDIDARVLAFDPSHDDPDEER